MREAGVIVAEVIEAVGQVIRPGVTTQKLDTLAETIIRDHGALPTFVGYQNYPKTLCTSINEQVVHGIPGDRVLCDGDIVGVDCGVTWKGFVADHAMTFCVGEVTAEKLQLIAVTEKALYEGIAMMQVGNRIGDISFAVQQAAEARGYGIVKDFVGHGVGRRMHEEPQVPNFGEPRTGPRLKVGMVLAIEPMFNLGTGDVKVLEDGWTVVTKDGRQSAHFEHTIAMTDGGPVVLTKKS